MKAKKSILSTFIAASMLVMLTGCDVRTILPSSTEESSVAEYSDDKSPANVYEYDIQDDGNIVITKYNGNESVVDIPSTIDGRSVVKIGSDSFKACRSITSAIIPESVNVIDDWAFSGCSSLNSVSIPNSVKEIGDWAFGSSSLTSVTIPDSVTEIGKSAFNSCKKLKNISISKNVLSLEEKVFYGCSNLESITIPNSVTSIGKNAFSDCTSLTNIVIPNSVTSIEHMAFSGCTSLSSVSLPDRITSLSGTFIDCKNLKSVVIPNSVKVIGYAAFGGCTQLKSVTIPSSVTGIEWQAFRSCYSLKLITIPDSVTEISDHAFEDSDPFVTYRGKTYAAYEYEDLYKAINYGSSQPETPVIKRKTFTFNTLTGSIYGLDFLVGYPDYDEVDNYLAQGKTPKYINVDVYYQCPGCFRETFCSRVKYSYNKEEAQMVTNIHCDNPRCSHYNENSSALLCSNIKN